MAQNQSSKLDVVVKVVLVFFVSLLSFSIGTFVGKKFSDNQYQLAKYEPSTGTAAPAAEEKSEGAERETASVPTQAPEVKPNTDEALAAASAHLSKEFENNESGARAPIKEEFLMDKNNHSVQEVKKIEPIAEKKTAVSAQAHPLDPAARVALGQAPDIHIPDPAESIPSSLPRQIAASPIGKFTVQVGSYKSEIEAQAKASELKSSGFDAFFNKANVRDRKPSSQDSIWYRVNIGLFATSDEAKKFRDNLDQKNKIKGFVQGFSTNP